MEVLPMYARSHLLLLSSILFLFLLACKTPIQKVSGCNHMTCLTPACNTHFCYHCGDLIVKSALRQEI
ncbi:hypothetical protein EDB83DRAFT_2439307, partial [Lactarius deliciosus]